MFNHYFDNSLQKAQPIAELVKQFEVSGTENIQAVCTEELFFTAEEWKAKTEKEDISKLEKDLIVSVPVSIVAVNGNLYYSQADNIKFHKEIK